MVHLMVHDGPPDYLMPHKLARIHDARTRHALPPLTSSLRWLQAQSRQCFPQLYHSVGSPPLPPREQGTHCLRGYRVDLQGSRAAWQGQQGLTSLIHLLGENYGKYGTRDRMRKVMDEGYCGGSSRRGKLRQETSSNSLPLSAWCLTQVN